METNNELDIEKMVKYPGSVLLKNHIKKWRNKGYLIVKDPWYDKTHEKGYEGIGDTFDLVSLVRAKYNVRLGVKYYQNGKYGKLNESDNRELKIGPYELVFVESYEVFKMPSNILAVYDLRIKCCLGGLGLQTGLQIDPGYHGRVFCPLFNFTDTPVTLEFKEQLASVQFIYTTSYNRQDIVTDSDHKKSERHEIFSLNLALEEPIPQSGLGKLYTELTELKKNLSTTESHFHTYTTSSFQAMAFIIGALAVVVSAVSIAVTKSISGAEIALPISIGAIILLIGLAIFLYNKKNNNKK